MAPILYAESHYEGAYRDWIDSYTARSTSCISCLSIPDGDWWLHGGALINF
ncbi:MAG TPA: hypothetical protein VJZ27_14975 [Aggregatilineales bacterium]|nr:hypothetical protein [Aggregatilineales bacterium]